jgi:hypothetical protein
MRRYAVLLVSVALTAGNVDAVERQVMRLDGTWQVAEGSLDTIPDEFPHCVPVPGLLDMAQPAFTDVGVESTQRQAFWYRRQFKIDGDVPPVALLKVYKAKYGSKVFLNGIAVAEELACFTPVLINVREHLLGGGQTNNLIIRVGADREFMPSDVPSGWDFEKYLYIPGIYDSVDLILSGYPFIANVQTVPDIEEGQVRIVAEILADQDMDGGPLDVSIAATRDGEVVAESTSKLGELKSGATHRIDLTTSLDNCRLWSPEDPFLYQLTVSTDGDRYQVRFGMREFRFDQQTKQALLNGKPYIMRGTNVCIYRFFEDETRADLPWRKDWVRKLHRQFKSMHWNSVRYCIGFPPEIWYEVADEEGFLIQDEFPIWLLGKAPEDPKAEKIVPQYASWMRERWNHPCVVIWDAQNESHSKETGMALQKVRNLDLSDRPWENGWAEPQKASDCVEAHPYMFIRAWQDREPFRLTEMPTVSGTPNLLEAQKKKDVPIIVNEYGWLWLDREGQPTCLTEKVYASLLGTESTVEQRRELYARYLAALTEFWRCHRQCAGVLHFCGLAYSRPGNKPRPEGGATSDHFLDVAGLELEPMFAKYVGDAFNPLGLMLDFWVDEVPADSNQSTKVYIVNDLEDEWQGEITFRITRAKETVASQKIPARVAGLGREIVEVTFTMPKEAGAYTLIAELTDSQGHTIGSLRDVLIK